MAVTQEFIDRLSMLAVVAAPNGTITRLNKAGTVRGRLTEGGSFSPVDLPDHFRVVKSISGATDRFTTAIRNDGQTRLVEWTTSPLPDGATLYTGLDVTRERRSFHTLQELARQNAGEAESRMRFLASMSHEMRTPLNGILGMSRLLLESEVDANQRTYSQAIQDSGRALLTLINDILEYSKLEAGQLELEQAPMNPAVLVQSVAELLAPRAEPKDLEVTTVIDQAIPLQIVADENRIRQVLMNLASNAVKFTETGGVQIKLAASPHPKDHDRCLVTFSVQDTGIGISSHDRNRIFEEYGQADDTTEKNKEGTGLGLSISKQLTAAMDSELVVESTVGEGSTFSFQLNVKIAEAPTKHATPPQTTNVIIFTENAVLGNALVEQCKYFGALTAEYTAAPRRLETLIANDPMAQVLCDAALAEVCSPFLKDCTRQPVVLIGANERAMLETYRQLGLPGYLMKPVRAVSLHRQLQGKLISRKPKAEPAATQPAADMAPSTATTETHEASAETKNSKRVLIVEDNQINIVLAKSILKRAGHTFDVAMNGEEAVNAVSAADYDIVLMDMRMPVCDGPTASRRIREKGYTDIPIIALTANGSKADRDMCAEAGMNGFISKPFEPEELLQEIERLVSAQPEEAAAAG